MDQVHSMDVIAINNPSHRLHPSQTPHSLSASLPACGWQANPGLPSGGLHHPSPRPKEGAGIMSPPSFTEKTGLKEAEHGSQGVPPPQPHPHPLQSPPAWPCSEQPSADPRVRPLSPHHHRVRRPKVNERHPRLNRPSVLPRPAEPGGAGPGAVTHLPDGEQAPSSSFPGGFRFLRGMLRPLAQAADLRDRRGLRCLLAGSPPARQLPGPRLPFAP